tara:strand:+ start:527 stop:706 length:180 start_codon:yes stop_codon:yes gene_type:complete
MAAPHLIFNLFDVYFIERFTHHLAEQCSAIRNRMHLYIATYLAPPWSADVEQNARRSDD